MTFLRAPSDYCFGRSIVVNSLFLLPFGKNSRCLLLFGYQKHLLHQNLCFKDFPWLQLHLFSTFQSLSLVYLGFPNIGRSCVFLISTHLAPSILFISWMTTFISSPQFESLWASVFSDLTTLKVFNFPNQSFVSPPELLLFQHNKRCSDNFILQDCCIRHFPF